MAAAAVTLFAGEDEEQRGKERGTSMKNAAGVIKNGCMILSMLFRHGGPPTREIALRVPMVSPLGHPVSLLNCFLRWLEIGAAR
ncbi:unnamed protein product, partial [Discosporangium mesarthrocarpum]